jgi:cation diffusion facilitator family transporter
MDPPTSSAALRASRRNILVGAAVNLALAGFKLAVGVSARSQALVADGFHSLSDLLTDAVVWVGIKLGRIEADHNHPFGHGRIETLASLGVGLALALTGVGLAYESIIELRDHTAAPSSPVAVLAAAISILAKEILFRYTRAVGRRIRSTALKANAWHHRSDALSSVAVLVGVGAGLVSPKLAFMDHLAALAVAAMILNVAWKIGRGAVLEVVDTSPPDEVVERVTAVIRNVPGVVGEPSCRLRRSGPHLLMECVILVDGSLTLSQAHAISESVEEAVIREEPSVSQAAVHVEPA